MKNLTKLCVAIGAATMLASQAFALTIGDARTIGIINPGTPSGQAEALVQNLIDFYNADSAGGTIGPNDYTTFNLGDFGNLPDADELPDDEGKDDTSNNQIDVTGFLYLLGKYDQDQAGTVVWYVGGLSGVQEIPQFFDNGQHSLSHSILLNRIPVTTPDGGMTLLLLGAGLAAVGGARRFIKS